MTLLKKEKRMDLLFLYSLPIPCGRHLKIKKWLPFLPPLCVQLGLGDLWKMLTQ